MSVRILFYNREIEEIKAISQYLIDLGISHDFIKSKHYEGKIIKKVIGYYHSFEVDTHDNDVILLLKLTYGGTVYGWERISKSSTSTDQTERDRTDT